MEDIRVAKTKESINQSFFYLLTKFSFSQITVGNICVKSRISRSTFYFHYEDKYHLLRENIKKYVELFDPSLKIRFTHIKEKKFVELLNTLSQKVLSPNQERLLLLFNIHEKQGGDLEKALKNKLQQKFKFEILNKVKTDITCELLSELYCNNVITLIKWALRNELSINDIKFVAYTQEILLKKVVNFTH
ncbi:hypothetical protein ACYUJ6_09060 [Clostridium sp. JNZ X4-2]